MKKAILPLSEKSLILASVQSNLASPVAAQQMRRPRGQYVGAACQDVSVAVDMDVSREVEADDGARIAYRQAKKKAKKRGGERRRGEGRK